MKVTAFVGSARKKHTYHTTEKLLQKLESFGNVEYEIVQLNNYHLETCKGCRLCLDKGEEFCALKDDRNILIEKMLNSDGVVFASPNYSFHVSGFMKVFLDRLGFVFHRPRFFGKTFTSIVAQGVTKGGEIVKYFNFVGKGLGFNVVKGCCIKSIEPITEKGQKKIDKAIERQSKRFYSQLTKEKYPKPSLFWLMGFRMARSSIKKMLNEEWRDYVYYRENGWFESDYFYPVKLNPLKKLAGKLFDTLAVQIIRL